MTGFDPDTSAAAQRLVGAVLAGDVKLAPVLEAKDVAAFEEAHGIRLPAEYRWLVTHVGNGGEGPPYYGIEPLSDRVTEKNSLMHTADNRNHRLSECFPTQPGDWSRLAENDADEQWAAYEAGRLLLGTDGCAILWVLAITGPARGQVWRLGDDTARPAEPAELLEWYASWIDQRPPGGPDDPIPIALEPPPTRSRAWSPRALMKRLLRSPT